jgi:hypothetical protein
MGKEDNIFDSVHAERARIEAIESHQLEEALSRIVEERPSRPESIDGTSLWRLTGPNFGEKERKLCEQFIDFAEAKEFTTAVLLNDITKRIPGSLPGEHGRHRYVKGYGIGVVLENGDHSTDLPYNVFLCEDKKIRVWIYRPKYITVWEQPGNRSRNIPTPAPALSKPPRGYKADTSTGEWAPNTILSLSSGFCTGFIARGYIDPEIEIIPSYIESNMSEAGFNGFRTVPQQSKEVKPGYSYSCFQNQKLEDILWEHSEAIVDNLRSI